MHFPAEPINEPAEQEEFEEFENEEFEEKEQSRGYVDEF